MRERPASDRSRRGGTTDRGIHWVAVQEIEDIDALRQFVRDDLAGLYRDVVLIEGNDRGGSTSACSQRCHSAA